MSISDADLPGTMPAMAGRKRPDHVLVTIPPAELEEIDAGAKRDRLSRSEYVRAAALYHARGGGLIVPVEHADAIRAEAERRGVAVQDLVTLYLGIALGVAQRKPAEPEKRWATCEACFGSGKLGVIGKQCGACEGRGEVIGGGR